jgi:hypothetical protein
MSLSNNSDIYYIYMYILYVCVYSYKVKYLYSNKTTTVKHIFGISFLEYLSNNILLNIFSRRKCLFS